MIIRFWGVRGTVPTPGPSTVRYGGNTSCVSMTHGALTLVIDAGSGVVPCGEALLDTEEEIAILFTHRHMDHVSAFPFFRPLYQPGRVVHLLQQGVDNDDWTPLDLFDRIRYPMGPDVVEAQCSVIKAAEVPKWLHARDVTMDAFPLNHPGGALGYRLRCEDATWVHISDNELADERPEALPLEHFVHHCQDADVLSHDAQYLESDYPAKKGWGHSRVGDVCELARKAGVRHLVLFHHDPKRTDADLDRILADARQRLEPYGIRCTVAYEGLEITC